MYWWDLDTVRWIIAGDLSRLCNDRRCRYLGARSSACGRSDAIGQFRRYSDGRGLTEERRGTASLDQVSPTRRYKERSPPLPVLSVHTIFYLVDTITSFDGPDGYAKVEHLVVTGMKFRVFCEGKGVFASVQNVRASRYYRDMIRFRDLFSKVDLDPSTTGAVLQITSESEVKSDVCIYFCTPAVCHSDVCFWFVKMTLTLI